MISKQLSGENGGAVQVTGTLWLVIVVCGMRSREYTPAGGWSLAAPFPSLLSSACHFHFFLFWVFLLHNASKFWLFHLKKISIFDLNFFCSYCFCFLLFMKFLNTARISSLFYERAHSVCCSSLSWVLEPSCYFKLLYPIRLLWHIVWAPFPHMALLLPLSVSAAQPSLLCVGLMESALGPCVPKLCSESAKQYSNNCNWGWMHSFTHAHDKSVNKNVDIGKDKTHNNTLSFTW